MPKRKVRWTKMTNLVPAIFFSAGYLIITIFNLLGTSHPPSISTPNAAPHILTPRPFLSLLYLVVALLCTWAVYYYYQEKANSTSFAVSMVMGILMILVGILLWITATY